MKFDIGIRKTAKISIGKIRTFIQIYNQRRHGLCFNNNSMIDKAWVWRDGMLMKMRLSMAIIVTWDDLRCQSIGSIQK
jgi:hypothetical protein